MIVAQQWRGFTREVIAYKCTFKHNGKTYRFDINWMSLHAYLEGVLMSRISLSLLVMSAISLLFTGCDMFGLDEPTENEAAEALHATQFAVEEALDYYFDDTITQPASADVDVSIGDETEAASVDFRAHDLSQVVSSIKQWNDDWNVDYAWQQDFEEISGSVELEYVISDQLIKANYDVELKGGVVETLRASFEFGEDSYLDEDIEVTANGHTVIITSNALNGSF